MRTSLVRLCLPVLLAGVVAVAPAAPAAASCALPAPSSAVVFTGTVTAVADDGRVATVRTDDGRVVQVVGTPDRSAAATSVDRRFAVGARYEFHPLNDAPPYQDNACTATRQVGADPDGMPRWLVPAAIGAIIALATVTIVVVARRRRVMPPS
jgi:hypothetical protein